MRQAASVDTLSAPDTLRSIGARSHLWLALLAFLAGAVDAIALLETGRFASHMSGTTSTGVIALAESRFTAVALGASAVSAFVAGAALCGVVIGPDEKTLSVTRLRLLLIIEGVLIAGGAVAAPLMSGAGEGRGLLLPCLAAAMGLGNNMGRRALHHGTRTTHVTGSLTDLGAGLGSLVRAAVSHEVWPAKHRARTGRAGLLVALFVAGGTTAGLLHHLAGLASVVLPVSVVLLLLLTTTAARQADAVERS